MARMNLKSVSKENQVDQEEFAVIGRIRSAWGRWGEVRIQPSTDNLSRFSPGQSVYIGSQRYVSGASRIHKGDVLLKLEGVNSFRDAEALQGAWIEVPLEWLAELPENTFYHFQLLGMDVWTSQGEHLGKVEQIIETGSNDVYVVRGGKRETLLPAIEEVVREVDVMAGRMVVVLLEGL